MLNQDQWATLLIAGIGAAFAAALTGLHAAIAGVLKHHGERKAEGRDHCHAALNILSGVTARGYDRADLERQGVEPFELSRSEGADLERERVFIPDLQVRNAIDDAITISQLAWAAQNWATPSVDARQMRSQAVTSLREALGAYARRDPLPVEHLQSLHEASTIAQTSADEEWGTQNH